MELKLFLKYPPPTNTHAHLEKDMESGRLYFALNPMFRRPLLDVLNSTFGTIAMIVMNVLPGSILSKKDVKMLPMSSKIICHYSLALNVEIEEKMCYYQGCKSHICL